MPLSLSRTSGTDECLAPESFPYGYGRVEMTGVSPQSSQVKSFCKNIGYSLPKVISLRMVLRRVTKGQWLISCQVRRIKHLSP